VKKCRFENVAFGIFTNYAGSSNFYIADNYFFGRDDSSISSVWNGAFWRNSTESKARNSRRFWHPHPR
jgi:hypothetical protein